MAILAYTILHETMKMLIDRPKPAGHPIFYGLAFQLREKGKLLEDIKIVPLFSNGTDSIISVEPDGGENDSYNKDLLKVSNVAWHNATPDHLQVDDTDPYLYKKLEYLNEDSKIPNIAYFDALSLEFSVKQKADFIVSGASMNTGTLLGTYDKPDPTTTPATLKIEVKRSVESLAPKKAPGYLLGQPCTDTWYNPRKQED